MTVVPTLPKACRPAPRPDDGAELQRVVHLLDDRLEAAVAAVPPRLRRWIPAALLQLAVGRAEAKGRP